MPILMLFVKIKHKEFEKNSLKYNSRIKFIAFADETKLSI